MTRVKRGVVARRRHKKELKEFKVQDNEEEGQQR